MRIAFLSFLFLVVLTIPVTGIAGTEINQPTDKDSLYRVYMLKSDPILSAIDSLMYLKFFETSDFTANVNELNVNHFELDYIPEYPDLIYECKILDLHVKSPIDLEFNIYVKRYIDIYTKDRREQVSRMLGLAELYYPIFEETLAKYNLPLELKHLAVVESALNPRAKSKSGAVGLWQFLYNSSKMFDLTVDSYVDERMDPYKSTDAACQYLEYLYRIFDDWQLALAAYNGGPGVVRNAIQRSGGKTEFWAIRPYLPKETQNYVPAFIAANYVMSYPAEHNIYPTPPKFYYNEVDTVQVTQDLHFDHLSTILNIPVETLEFLNPVYSKNYIPNSSTSYPLVLPLENINDFIRNEINIYNPEYQVKKEESNSLGVGSTENKVHIYHIVEKGEYFHKIAIQYRCTIDDIKSWNNMTTNFIYAGLKLNIWAFPDQANAYEESQEKIKQARKNTDNCFYYTVKKGDTLWSIANRFNCESIGVLIEVNDLIDNNLSPGTTLKVIPKYN